MLSFIKKIKSLCHGFHIFVEQNLCKMLQTFSFSFKQITSKYFKLFCLPFQIQSTYHHHPCLLWRTSFGSEQNEIRSNLFFSSDWFDRKEQIPVYCLNTIGFHQIFNMDLENCDCKDFDCRNFDCSIFYKYRHFDCCDFEWSNFS